MIRARALPALLLPLALSACGVPVPAERADYVGEWQHPAMYLLITEDGSIRYRRIRGGATTSIEGPLRGFDGPHFSVGVWPMVAKFEVSVPPHQADGEWRMVVDGVELVRARR
jgi:hypothetical protein